MHANTFDQYQFRVSRLHEADPRSKVVMAVALIISNALLPDGSWLAFGLAWLLLLFANEQANLGLWFTFRRSLVALPFALVGVSAIFSPFGEPLAALNLGFITLVPTDFGVIRFFSILTRAWLSVQAAILLVATTLFPDLIHALEHLRVPRVLTTIISFLYRYLFVLSDEALRLLRAREARSAGLAGQKCGGSVFWRAKVMGHMVGQLFLRSYERSERIYHAMLARGYAGHIRTLHPHQMRRADWRMLAFASGALLLIQLVGWLR